MKIMRRRTAPLLPLRSGGGDRYPSPPFDSAQGRHWRGTKGEVEPDAPLKGGVPSHNLTLCSMTKLIIKENIVAKGPGRPKGVMVAGLDKRNAAIADRVSRNKESYRKIGADYGLTRERVRQIAQDLLPRTGVRRDSRTLKFYGNCPRCQRPLRKHEANGSRRPNPVDLRNELCGGCRREIYGRPVKMVCFKCGKVRIMKNGILRWFLNNDVRVGHMKLDAGGSTGTRLCQRCTYDAMKVKGLGQSLELRFKASLKGVTKRQSRRN